MHTLHVVSPTQRSFLTLSISMSIPPIRVGNAKQQLHLARCQNPVHLQLALATGTMDSHPSLIPLYHTITEFPFPVIAWACIATVVLLSEVDMQG